MKDDERKIDVHYIWIVVCDDWMPRLFWQEPEFWLENGKIQCRKNIDDPYQSFTLGLAEMPENGVYKVRISKYTTITSNGSFLFEYERGSIPEYMKRFDYMICPDFKKAKNLISEYER